MRTNFGIDDERMAKAVSASGMATKTLHGGGGLAFAGARASADEGAFAAEGPRLNAIWKRCQERRTDASRRSAPCWVAHLRGHRTEPVRKPEFAAGREPLLIGDLILLEALQGARDVALAALIERGLRAHVDMPLLSASLAPLVARNYRKLRGLGARIRKTADIIIGT